MINRSMSIDVFLPEDRKEKYQAILNSIRHYRAVARHVYALLFESQAAGADFDLRDESFRLLPNNERAKTILALAMDKMKESGVLYKAPVYEVREYVLKQLAPNWTAFVFDSLRQDVYARWKAPDTEFPKAQRGYMSLQGARGVAKFQRLGIGFPQATARPRLEGHSIFLKWDREIGEIEFKFSKLDGRRHWIWKNIIDNVQWNAGTLYLKERDGLLRILISYSRPEIASDLDPERSLSVVFSDEPDSFLRMTAPDGIVSYDSVSALAALAGLDRLSIQSRRCEARMAAAGNKRKPWGYGKAFRDESGTLNGVTLNRELQIKDWNHRWTKRIVDNMKRWRTNNVTVTAVREKTLFNRPWQWCQFKAFLTYKVNEIGGTVTFLEPPEGSKQG